MKTWAHPHGVVVDKLLCSQVNDSARPVIPQVHRHDHTIYLQDGVRQLRKHKDACEGAVSILHLGRMPACLLKQR